MKILIFGLPGSGKTTLAEPLAKLLGGVWINADQVRERYEGRDQTKWDFSEQGRINQAKRISHIADGVVESGKVAVADFVCPTAETRKIFNADFTVWMDTLKEGRYEDTNDMFEPAERYDVDYHVAKWFDDTHTQLVPIIERYMKKQNTTPIGYVAWRLENEDL